VVVLGSPKRLEPAKVPDLLRRGVTEDPDVSKYKASDIINYTKRAPRYAPGSCGSYYPYAALGGGGLVFSSTGVKSRIPRRLLLTYVLILGPSPELRRARRPPLFFICTRPGRGYLPTAVSALEPSAREVYEV